MDEFAELDENTSGDCVKFSISKSEFDKRLKETLTRLSEGVEAGIHILLDEGL